MTLRSEYKEASANLAKIIGANGQAINATPWKADVVTPDAAVELPKGMLYVGTAGHITVRPAGQDNFVEFKNIPNGTFFPVIINGVSDDSTASDMLICY